MSFGCCVPCLTVPPLVALSPAASLRQCCIEVALPPAPAPLPPAPVCQGVQINYTVLSLTNIPDPTGLAYGFQSLVSPPHRHRSSPAGPRIPPAQGLAGGFRCLVVVYSLAL
jgi:hypothetical protein